MKKRQLHLVIATHDTSSEQIYFTKGIIMENLRATFMKWRRKTSNHKYTRLEQCPDQLFDAEQTTLRTEEESVKFTNNARRSSSKFHTSDYFGNTAMNYGECNGVMKNITILD